MDPFLDSHEDLEKSIKLFNRDMESKSVQKASIFVLMDKREEFLTQMHGLKDKLSFFESNIINIKFYKDDVPIKIDSNGRPEDRPNQTVVVIRYKLSILPSTKLKTQIVSQEWVLQNEKWYVIPNLDQFIN